MKILLIKPFARVPDRKGYNLQEEGIAKEFARLGHDCSLVFYSGRRRYWTEAVAVDDGRSFLIHWIPALKLHDNCIFDNKHLRPLLEEADMILTEELRQWQSGIVAMGYPKKTVIYHGPYLWKQPAAQGSSGAAFLSKGIKRALRTGMNLAYESVFLKRLLKNDTPVVTKSDLARQLIVAKGYRGVRTIPVGLDLEKFSDGSAPDPAAPRGEAFPLLYVGALQPRRNILFMLRLTSQLRGMGIPATLTLVGAGQKKYEAACRKACEALGIAGHVTFSGPVEQAALPAIYRAHPVFLLPTDYEIFGMVMLEAMYFGCAVLTTFHGGSDMAIEHGVNGFILPRNDPGHWTRVLADLHEGKYDRQRIGENAHRTILDDYTWKRSAAAFLEVFEDLRRREDGGNV